MRAAGVAGSFHAQLACRVAAQKVALHAARFHHLARLDPHAFIVKRRTALATFDKRVFKNVNVRRQHPFAQRIEQERTLAVQRTTADGLHKSAQQAGCQR